ncbi:SsgA family sporulation/cell division regulator [Streptomyces sp. YIM 98790]|uniref:SsgA family sporulation/cell division regulator n=1 Tax=Streptomyces sp. YIM 98790 TaxID=2689077 RepID=UPI00140CA329|nr:SsgA family sporulation/cell division regulator [Streptomyces sp. YIM 98790]
MSTSVTACVLMELEVAEGAGLPVAVELSYTSTDPYAVRMTFPQPGPGDQPITWCFARELLIDGLSARSGMGDVRVTPCPARSGPSRRTMSPPRPDDRIRLSLRVGPQQAALSIGAYALKAFLDSTCSLVPPGRESGHLDIDTALERIITSGT